jgi:excisionase family DNA binding protein
MDVGGREAGDVLIVSPCAHHRDPEGFVAQPSGGADACRPSRSFKGVSMEKTSLIAWRHREQHLPDTAAQRRARARAQIRAGGPPGLLTGMLDGGSLAFTCDGLGLVEDECLAIGETTPLLAPDTLVPAPDRTVHRSSATDLRVPLTAGQSQALRALPLLTDLQGRAASSVVLQFEETREPYGITLQFRLHPEEVPEMISLQDLCRQLNVGHRAVMRLVRTGALRCYRVGHRYRFSVSDVTQYLARMASQ